LRGGFKKLDPRRIPPDKIEEAASGDALEPATLEVVRLDAALRGGPLR
jgi:hypothetical protein